MPVTDSFLADCRDDITGLAELAAFRAALASVGAGSADDRRAAWTACFDDNQGANKSPAHRLRQAVRDTVRARADAAGTLSPLDRESAYRTLVAEFVPAPARPPSRDAEYDETRRELVNELLS